MKKFFLLIIILLGTFVSKAQDINSYKYILVPLEFDFLKEPDQYQLNSLTKFLFEKNGFETYFMGEELPEEFSKNQCEALVAEIEDNSGLFRTRVNIILKDCYNRQVFISDEGISIKKDFKEAYHEALRNAFQTIENLNYNYNETIVTGRPEVDRKTENSLLNREETKGWKKVQNPVSISSTDDLVQIKNTVDSKIIFSRDNSKYVLKKTTKGFNFHQEEMEEPFAALLQTSSPANFIYSAINAQGMAHFDENGNLIVEILDIETGAVETIVYKLKH